MEQGAVRTGKGLAFRGCSHFRQRIICSLLSGKSIKITDIRLEAEVPGLREFEMNLLRLVDKISNGTKITVNETGTGVYMQPGSLVGGLINHDCNLDRGIGYYLEPLIWVAPFCKNPLSITLTGVTNNEQDTSVDLLRTVTLPLLRHFGLLEGIQLKIEKRGAPPLGGGQIHFTCPVIRELQSVQLTEEGKIRRIRGIAYATRVTPQIPNRVVDSAKAVLIKYQQDTFIYSDHYKGNTSGLSPGYGLALVAEGTVGSTGEDDNQMGGVVLGSECVAEGGSLPEELGRKAAYTLLSEVANRGCVDTSNQATVLLFMALGPASVSKVRLGRLSPYTIKFLRGLKDFFNIKFKLEPDEDTHTVMCTCVGIGFQNINRKIF
eukprot:TRINITY_DN4185_c0_g1_i1.p1 TRINITY_DN4185_c0_g1~~TRINITY_DN4185_c0_g1_i1.p1  ORF type:complete len:377 (-),score=38.10 TRINITY_DN4185_c0_g1_i1:545-1675(-)